MNIHPVRQMYKSIASTLVLFMLVITYIYCPARAYGQSGDSKIQKVMIYVTGNHRDQQTKIETKLISLFRERYRVLPEGSLAAFLNKARIHERQIQASRVEILRNIGNTIGSPSIIYDHAVVCEIKEITSYSGTTKNGVSVNYGSTSTADVYYINLVTGQISYRLISASKGNTLLGGIVSDGMTRDQAILASGQELCKKIAEQYVEFCPITGRVLKASGDQVLLNVGQADGVQNKSRFDIIENNKTIGSSLIYEVHSRTSRGFVYKGENKINIGMNVKENNPNISTPDDPGTVISSEFTANNAKPSQYCFMEGGLMQATRINDHLFAVASGNDIFIIDNMVKTKTLSLHKDYVIAMAVTPDGQSLITASLDNKIIQWDCKTWSIQKILAPSSAIAALAISLSGSMVAVADASNSISLYKLPKLEISQTIPAQKKTINAVAFCSDEQLLAFNSEEKIVLWDMRNNKQFSELKGHKGTIRAMAFIAHNNTLMSVSDDATIQIWNMTSKVPERVLQAHMYPVTATAISQDGRFALTTGVGRVVRIWDTSSWSEIASFRAAAEEICSSFFSTDGASIVTASADGDIKSWNLDQFTLVAQQRALPAELSLNATFVDDASFFPNKILNGAELGELLLRVGNSGDGSGYNVNFSLKSDNDRIIVPSTAPCGDIAPLGSKEIRVPIKADLDVTDGLANVTIEAKEKRGYDARPVQLQIPVRHLDKPDLSYVNFTLNDGSSGQASGNGNGRAENGETVEVTAFIKNSGVGPALNTTVRLDAAATGAEIRQGSANLGTISPGETKQARMVVHIPRTFTGSQLQLSFAARDTIGASVISKEHILPMSRLSPILAIESRFLDERGIQVDQLQNGARYVLEVIVRNEGQLNAKSVTSRISSSQITDLTVSSAAIGDLASGASAAPVRFNFSLPRNYRAGTPQFALILGQVDFPDLIQNITIPILFKEPRLSIRDILSTSDGNQEISQGETVHVDVAIENTGSLDAEGVIADLEFNHQGIDFRDRSMTSGRIPAGATSPSMRYSFLVKTGATVGPLNGILRVRQADGFPGTEKSFALEIKPIGAQVVTITPSERPAGTPSFGQAAVRANSAPFVAVSAKNISADNKSSEPFLKLEIQVQDDKVMLSLEPEIRVNGKLQTKELGLRGIDMQERETREADRRIRFFRQVELNEGFNDIEVRVYDADNEMGFDNVQIEFLSQRTDVYALVVGVGEYQSSSIDPLQFAAADAQSFHDYLRTPEGGGLDSDHIRLLLNGEATRDKILNAMEWLASRSFENDLVIIYMAMHGMVDQGEFYFLGYDSDPKSLFATGVKRSEVEALQQRLRSSKVVWFADACHSGSLGEDPQIAMRASRASSTNRLLGEIAKARNGLAMFMSAQYDQYSQESPKWGGGHGVFTYYLLKGLRGEADRNTDTFVTLSELYDFVSRQVSEATEGKQNPKLGGGTYDRSLTLSVVK